MSFFPLEVSPKDFYNSSDFDRYHLKADINIDLVIIIETLEPDVVILEPTGSYSKYLIKELRKREIVVLQVDQTVVKQTRRSFFGTEGKTDAFDALLLTQIYWERWHARYDRMFWVKDRDPIIDRLKNQLLDMKGAAKKSTAARNTIKQRLISGEWPAKAKINSIRLRDTLHIDQLPPFYAWLAGWYEQGDWALTRWKTRWDRQYKEALAADEAYGLSEQTRELAYMVCLCHRSEARTEQEFLTLLYNPVFMPYHRAFDRFGFSTRERAWFLCRLYPFEDLLKNGKPHIEYRRGRSNANRHKKVKVNHTERLVRQALGLGRSAKQSGKSQRSGSRLQGSKDARCMLWQYVHFTLETGLGKSAIPGKGDTCPDTVTANQARDYFIKRAFALLPDGKSYAKKEGHALKDARMATCRRVAEMLCRELIREFCQF